MRTPTRCNLPVRLEKTHRQFERWRRTRKGRSRIPEALWSSAVEAAGRYGLCRTARALRLDYYALKKRVEAGGCPAGGRGSAHESGREAVAGFIELARPVLAGSSECIVELEDPGGSKMRVHLKGGESPDLAALSRSFWGSACALPADRVEP